MNNILITWAALLCLNGAAFAMPIKGVVEAGKEKLSGVIVTDGFRFTRTDERGKFEMDTHDEADFIYIVTPDGYVASYESGTPEFYLPLKSDQKSYHFRLNNTGKTENCVVLAIADVQTRTDKHFKRFQEQSIPDLKSTIAAYPQNTRIIGISLGDIVWDHFEHFPVYKKEMAGLQIPFYAVIGNHDHDKNESTDRASEQAYKEHFGPNYYAFQFGEIYFIVLDNILYKGNKKYDEALTENQIGWVRGLLKYIPKGKQIIVATHSPFHFRDKEKIAGTDELLNALKGYKADFISGHTHLNSNFEIAPGVTEHNIGAICGTWWTADENRDGTPNGYGVLEFSGEKMEWYYKSTGHDRNWQFKVYPRGSVEEKPDGVVAKVWNWDNQWKVKWYEDGVLKGDMERFDSFDPDYLSYIKGLDVPKFTQPQKSFFYFFASPSPKAQKIEVEVTDRFGHTYPRQEVQYEK